MELKEFKDILEKKVSEIEDIILSNMPDKGNTCETSQKVCLMQALNIFNQTINGIEENDVTIKNLPEISYKGNDNETYSLIKDGEIVAQILTGEDGAMKIIKTIKSFLLSNSDDEYNVLIKNDGDKLGIIVDIWDEDYSYLIETTTIWFDDFCD